jgi:hypothetical protein
MSLRTTQPLRQSQVADSADTHIREAIQAATFMRPTGSPPEVMGLVLTAVITVAVLLLDVGVPLTITQAAAGNGPGGRCQHALNPASPVRTAQSTP